VSTSPNYYRVSTLDVGALKDRTGTTDLDTLSLPSPDHHPSTSGSAALNHFQTGAALYGKAPRLGGLLAFGAVAVQ